ncbi:MAG TPA: c-type cytochrome [Gaiellaceae bacterium]|nr:c-type cytochrome [Gaiellaceae bacterium]
MRRLAAVIILGSVALVAGCGGGDSGTESGHPGDKVFADSGCGGCHTLDAAGSDGTLGPNLDDADPSFDAVVSKVKTGGGAMPSFEGKLSEQEIRDVAAFVSGEEAGSAAEGIAAIKPFTPNTQRLEGCLDADCRRQAFGNVAFREGPKPALRLFAEKLSEDAVEADCHRIAHTIGAASLQHYEGDVGKALAEGNGICASGYYHGLLEWKLAGVPKDQVASVARTVCDQTKSTASSFVYYQCVHGLGHGLMLYTLYDLPAALRLCHKLVTSFDRVSCSGGVFMENQQSSYGITSKWLKQDDLIYPCQIVGREDKTYCYLLVTSQILPRVGWDWKKAADWCRRSEPDFVHLCFQSYGRDASGNSRQDPAKTRDLCANAGSGEEECIFGAVRDILNTDPSDLGATRLCELAKPAHRAHCAYGIGSIVAVKHTDAEAKRADCRRFLPGRYFADCLRGANA